MSKQEKDAMLGWLRDFNRAANPDWWSAMDRPENESQPLQIAAYDSENRLLGGLLASTQMSWLKIDIMAVRDDRRRSGVGRELVLSAEAEAKSRGCRYAFVDTMSYQASDFYRKCGYTLCGEIPDWDSHGHTKHYFRKNLED